MLQQLTITSVATQRMYVLMYLCMYASAVNCWPTPHTVDCWHTLVIFSSTLILLIMTEIMTQYVFLNQIRLTSSKAWHWVTIFNSLHPILTYNDNLPDVKLWCLFNYCLRINFGNGCHTWTVLTCQESC